MQQAREVFLALLPWSPVAWVALSVSAGLLACRALGRGPGARAGWPGILLAAALAAVSPLVAFFAVAYPWSGGSPWTLLLLPALPGAWAALYRWRWMASWPAAIEAGLAAFLAGTAVPGTAVAALGAAVAGDTYDRTVAGLLAALAIELLSLGAVIGLWRTGRGRRDGRQAA